MKCETAFRTVAKVAVATSLIFISESSLHAQERRILVPNETDIIWSIAYSPEGKLIAGASDDRTVKVWDASTGNLVTTLSENAEKRYYSVSFSPDGKHFAAGNDDGAVRIWLVKNWILTNTWKTAKGDGAWVVRYSPDGKTLAAGSLSVEKKNGVDELTIRWRLWDTMSGDLKHEIAHMGPHGFTAAFSPDSRVFATGAEELRLYDAATGKLIKSITAGHRSIRRVAFTPDGKRIVASSDWARPIATGICLESEVQLWDIATGKALYTIKDLNPWLMSLAISPDGQTLATGSEGPFQERHAKPRCEVCLWKIDNGERLQSLRLDGTRPYGMAFSPDGKTLAIATTEQVVIADPQTLKVRSQLFKTTHTPRWDKARIEIRPKQ